MKTLRILISNLLVLFGLLLLLEIALRISSPNYHYYYRTHPKQPDLEEILAKTNTTWLQADQQLGWVCQQKEDLLFPSPPVEDISYQINEQGFRNPFNFNDTFPAHKKRVLLIGDSFMFGIYQPEEKTITSRLQLAKGEDYIFFNLAIPAWGLDQMYLAYQQYIDLINPDQVILTFVDDDLMRSLEILFHGCGRKPCLKLVDQQLINNEDNPAWWEYLCWNNQIGNRMLSIHYQQKAVDLAKFMLTEIIEHEKSAGRKPSFIRIPALVDLQNQEAREVFNLKPLMEKQAVNYLELYDTLTLLPPEEFSSYYIPNDGHFTAEGTALLSDYILKWIE